MHDCINHKTCIDDALKEARLICEEKGLRFTQIREFILSMVWENHKPTKAYELLDKIPSMNYSSQPPTVYRALDFLLTNGFIHKINSLNAFVGCSHPLKHDECYFMICRKCYEIKECCDDQITSVIKKKLDSSQFSSKNIAIEISGDCYECSKEL